MSYERPDGRAADQLREIEIKTGFVKWPEGSVLCRFGDTIVLCNATVEERVPRWMRDQGRGWVTAEYAMLPRATEQRTGRESVQGRIGGRTHEISRLIGRALRAGIDLKKIGERRISIDCDVLQADGGTRTAAITGGWVALLIAIEHLKKKGSVQKSPVRSNVAAVSLGVIGEDVLLDLNYREDQAADTDLNLVMTEEGQLVEIQGTAEGVPFTREQLDRMLELGEQGIQALVKKQIAALEEATS